MNARGFFKKIVAVTLAGSMVFGSAMVTMADADSEQTNAQGYKQRSLVGSEMCIRDRV